MTDTPEAPGSLNVRFASKLGYEYLLTVRSFKQSGAGTELLELIPNIEKKLYEFEFKPIFGRNSQPQQQAQAPPPKPQESPKKKPCPIHEGKFLYRRTDDEGREWYSHKVGDEWCRGE